MKREEIIFKSTDFGLLSFFNPTLAKTGEYIYFILLVGFGLISMYLLIKNGNIPLTNPLFAVPAGALFIIGILDTVITNVHKTRAFRTNIQQIQDNGFKPTDQLLFDSQKEVILLNNNTREVKYIAMGDKSLITDSFSYDEISSIHFATEPKELTLQGLLAGAMIDGLNGSIKEPKLTRSFDFKLIYSISLSDGEELSITPIDRSFGYDLKESAFKSRVKEVLQDMDNQNNIMQNNFPGKVKAA